MVYAPPHTTQQLTGMAGAADPAWSIIHGADPAGGEFSHEAAHRRVAALSGALPHSQLQQLAGERRRGPSGVEAFRGGPGARADYWERCKQERDAEREDGQPR